MDQLVGKVAVITGGTQGLGAAIARHFSQQGAAGVIICGRNQAKGAEIAERLNAETDTPVIFVRADLSSVEDCRRVIAKTDELFGRVDVLEWFSVRSCRTAKPANPERPVNPRRPSLPAFRWRWR